MARNNKKGSGPAPPQTLCKSCPLRANKAFRKFAAEELEFMQGFKSGELVLDAGATILVEETNSPHLYTMLSGWAIKHKSLEDGRRQVLNFALPGDFLGLQASIFDSMHHTVQALTPVVLCVFPRAKLWTLYEKHSGLAFDVTWLASREETILADYLVTVGQRRAGERVAFILLHLFRRARQLGLTRGNKAAFPFTQEHLADTIGFSLVHTNKTLKQLRRSGTFKWTGADFELVDEEGLAAIAGEVPQIGGVRPLL